MHFVIPPRCGMYCHVPAFTGKGGSPAILVGGAVRLRRTAITLVLWELGVNLHPATRLPKYG
eukprot:362747-Chlamydomonas_euryale.AAC.3